MPVTLYLPGSLKDWLQGADEAACQGRTVGQCLDDLENRFPGFRDRVLDADGAISQVLVFLNGENVMKLSGLESPVKDGDELGIIPLAAGG